MSLRRLIFTSFLYIHCPLHPAFRSLHLTLQIKVLDYFLLNRLLCMQLIALQDCGPVLKYGKSVTICQC